MHAPQGYTMVVEHVTWIHYPAQCMVSIQVTDDGARETGQGKDTRTAGVLHLRQTHDLDTLLVAQLVPSCPAGGAVTP